MKAVGIVRRLDKLNRIVIPSELCHTQILKAGDPLEFFTEGNKIILQKYVPGTVLDEKLSDILQHVQAHKSCTQNHAEIVAHLEEAQRLIQTKKD